MSHIYLVNAEGKGTLVATVKGDKVQDWLDLFGVEGERYVVRIAG